MSNINSGEVLRAPGLLADSRMGTVRRSDVLMGNAVRAMGLPTEEIDAKYRETLTLDDIMPIPQDAESVPSLDVADVRQKVEMAVPNDDHYDQWRRMASDPSAPGGLN